MDVMTGRATKRRAPLLRSAFALMILAFLVAPSALLADGPGKGSGHGRGKDGGRSDSGPGGRNAGLLVERSTPAHGEPSAEPGGPIEFDVRGSLPFGFSRGFIVPSSLTLTVNGVDRTDEAEFVPGGLAALLPRIPAMRGSIRFVPQPQLTDGEHILNVRIENTSKRAGMLTSTLQIDSAPPTVAKDAPAPDQPITEPDSPIVVALEDEGVGIDWSTVTASVSGETATAEIDADAGHVTLSPEGQWDEGELRVAVEAADTLGNQTDVALFYDVRPDALAADIRAQPTTGNAPLTVTFTPEITTQTAIERYRWDFDGNGTTDRNDPIGRAQTHTYREEGTYDARLTVVDSRGEEASATVTIEAGNAPPEVTASAEPSNGAPPLEVEFSASASDRSGIATFEWDFDGDGAYERTTTTGQTAYTYEVEGTFQPRLRVTAEDDSATEIAVPDIEVRVSEGAPSVTAQASPASGEVPLAVTFDGSAAGLDGRSVSKWAWDFDRDGTADHTSATGPQASFTYESPSTYYPRLTVTLENGVSSSDVVRVVVESALSLSLSTDTIDTELNETVDIETHLGGDTRLSLVAETVGGRKVATLVPWQQRAAGAYTDSWDGRDDDGAFVGEGPYRIVLLYEVDGTVRRLDLSRTTGGNEYNPNRSRLPNNFAPFADDPLEIDFTLPQASRVTAFMGRYNVNARLVTFHQQTALGRGSHTIVWHGTTADGELIHPPPGDSFLFGIFAFTLPDNAVYVRSGVHATNLTSSPPVFSPGGAETGESAAELQFDLSRPGDVDLTVVDADTGAFVASRRYEGLPAGSNTIAWDGRRADGDYVAPGRYRLGIAGVDERGNRTTTVYTLQRIYY